MKDPFDRLKAQKEFSARYHCYIVLKGRYTMISCPDGTMIINPTGNPGMATAGAGDVLTGVIAAFRAQGMTAFASAVAGVYIHGMAGDIAKETCGERGMIASDIINHLPQSINSFD
jgi:NAD(P)H-hydrate epimerase